MMVTVIADQGIDNKLLAFDDVMLANVMREAILEATDDPNNFQRKMSDIVYRVWGLVRSDEFPASGAANRQLKRHIEAASNCVDMVRRIRSFQMAH